MDYLVYTTKEEAQEALDKINSEMNFKGVTKTWDNLRQRNDGKYCFRNSSLHKLPIKSIDLATKNEKYVEIEKDEKWFYTKSTDNIDIFENGNKITKD
jgi:hypothetical protein